MRRESIGQRLLSPGREGGVCSLDGPRQHADADVRCPDRPSAARGKDAPVRARFKPIAISGELATQDRQHMDDPYAGVGLGLAHPDSAAVEVHVMPVERQQLPEAQTGEGEGGDQGATQANGGAALVIELPGTVQERCDVLGAVEPGPGPA